MAKKIKKQLGIIFFGLAPIILASCSSLANPAVNHFNPQFTQVVPQNDSSKTELLNQNSMPILPWAQQYGSNSQVNPNGITLPNYSTANRNVLDFFIRRMIAISVGYTKNSSVAEVEYGTGIILGKATSNTNEWKYYVATNIHVSNNFLSGLNGHILGYQFAISPFFNQYFNNTDLPQPSDFTNLNKIAISADISKDQNNSLTSSSLDLSKSDFYPMLLTTNTNTYSNFIYQAKNLQMQNLQRIVKTNSNLVEAVQGPIQSFSNLGLAADFSIMEITFPHFSSMSNTATSNGLTPTNDDQKLQNYKKFLTSLKNLSDVKFATSKINSATSGYLMGYPSGWNQTGIQNRKIYMVNLAIQKPAALQFPLGHNLTQLEITNPPSVENLFNNQQIEYWTPTSNYSVANLNLGPGSSGSIYVNANAEIEGIYWGVIAGSDNQDQSNNNPKFTQPTSGQITKLKVKNNYDVITNLNNSQTANTGSNFCSVVTQRQSVDSNLRLPDFCH